jgi:hypothetical protein
VKDVQALREAFKHAESFEIMKVLNFLLLWGLVAFLDPDPQPWKWDDLLRRTGPTRFFNKFTT